MTNQQDIKAQRFDSPQRQLIKRLYSIKESAFYLGRTVCAVREMLWAGKMPYVKDGKRILVDIQDMNEWINKNKTRSIY
ncbi:MAG: helix-turn-helix domain-containing protein [Syntrophaceae bacterium]|nr:helix-turn-helix domain-containing protein [Syntrophaceae bacterium]